jgi:hypothetical protein
MSLAPTNSAPSGLDRIAGLAYGVMLIFYWALLYTASLTEEVERGSLLYFFYVGPVLLFAGLFGSLLLVRHPITPPLALLVSYAIVVIGVAIARADFPTVSSTVILSATLFVVAGARLAPPPQTLNWLFLASRPGGLISYLAGNSVYGIIPGLSLDEELWWRISLFPVVPESAFFSAIILLVNVLHRDLPMRRTCLALALYFLLFSGLRSALIGTGMALALLFAVDRAWLKSPGAVMRWLLASCIGFVVFLLLIDLIKVAPAFRNEFLNSYLFRMEEGLSSTEDLTKSIYRTWLWSEHLRIAASNPLFGIGTFDFAAISDNSLELGIGSGSESFLTGLYARVGLPALLLLGFFVSTIWRQLKGGRVLPALMGSLLAVAMLAYGSFLVSYNFVFLVMVGLICGSSSLKSIKRASPKRTTLRRSNAGALEAI